MESLLRTSTGAGIPAHPKASRLHHHKPDAVLEETQGQWTRLGQADGGPLAWVLGPLLGLALGTAALLSGLTRRCIGLPVQKSERFSSRCLASSSTRDASQRRDCPFVFKRGTARFLKSLIYSCEHPHTPSPTLLPPTHTYKTPSITSSDLHHNPASFTSAKYKLPITSHPGTPSPSPPPSHTHLCLSTAAKTLSDITSDSEHC